MALTALILNQLFTALGNHLLEQENMRFVPIKTEDTACTNRSRTRCSACRSSWSSPPTGVGSNIFAFLGTYHQHGEQQHSFESWLKQFLQHPNEVLSIADPRHWSERSFVALCRRTADTSNAPSPLSSFLATRSTNASTTGMCTEGGVPGPGRRRSRPS